MEKLKRKKNTKNLEERIKYSSRRAKTKDIG